MSDTPDPACTGPDATAAPAAPPFQGSARDTKNTLIRAVLMIVFAVFIAVAENLLILIALAQALWLLFTGRPNAAVREFGASLALWLQQAARFQCVASEDKPFPWAPWPKAPADGQV